LKVRCCNPACRQWKEKAECVPCGLGWCCDADCRWKATEARRGRLEQRDKKVKEGGYAIPQQRTISNAKNGPSSEKRQYIQQRDGRRCRRCGITARRNLHVHHVIYRSEGGNHEETNLITLCFGCHDRIHSSKRYFQPILLEVLRLHYQDKRFLTVTDVEREFLRTRTYGEFGWSDKEAS
jgi:5-methylcytosine-specific restriction endonuclease McrA